uniref:Cytochrome P450 CYP340K1 n=1 Tax=Helicoverpa armigera TaxID=29058 RepID=A0A068ETS4_HELAM|nr:cytochrome P450 CYP340K1 [Helicoverpa armigera]
MLSFILIIGALCLLFIFFMRADYSREREEPKSGVSVTRSLWLKRLWPKTIVHPLPPALPGALPIIGHLHKGFTWSSNLFNFFKTLSEDCVRQGGITVLKLGPEIHYVITDPQDALTAAKSCLRKHYVFEFAKVWQGNNLATSSGETWRQHRKMMNPAFSLPVIHGFIDLFNSQAKKLINTLEPFVGKGPFDHSTYFLRSNFETLCAGTFGIDAISQKQLDNYVSSAYAVINLIVAKLFKVWLQIDLIYKLSGLKKKEDQLVENLHSLTETVLQKKKLARENEAMSNTVESKTSGLQYKPVLDLLVDLSANGALTEKEVKEQTEALLTAGFETTSNQMAFMTMLLGAHPEVQDKLYEELIAVLGPDSDVGKDDLNKLVYTNAVIMETVRVFPTVPVILRCVDQDVKLKNYTMSAGTYCIIFPLVPNIPTKDFKGDQFKPERWLDDNFNGKQDFAGFGLGKRGCTGKTYVMTAMKVMLAHFIRRYRVRADTSQLQLSADFVLKPVSGCQISIERRHCTAA